MKLGEITKVLVVKVGECRRCHGVGFVWTYDDRDDPPSGFDDECQACDGTGVVECSVEVPLRELAQALDELRKEVQREVERIGNDTLDQIA